MEPIKRPKRPRDMAQLAKVIVDEATGQVLPEPEVVSGSEERHVRAGRLGGKKGGRARAAKLTPEQRREIAKKAASARWQKS